MTLIKRDFLIYPDIGYALLPNYMHKGYAKEAIFTILQELKYANYFEKINAITLLENEKSVSLLMKLNFKFENEILDHSELLHL